MLQIVVVNTSVIEIGLDYLNDVDTSSAAGGNFLQYDENEWKGAAMNLSSLSDVNSTMLSPSGKFLYYDGAQWDVKSIKVQELADVEAGMGAGKVMVGRSDGTKFEFADYTLDGLTNVNSTGKGVGSVLVWKGDALGWKVDTNKISDINELMDLI